MTTDVEVKSSLSLLVDNDVYDYKNLGLPNKIDIAGIRWTIVDASSCQSLSVTSKIVYNLLTDKLPDWKLWLLVGNSALQPNNKIVRYRGLWGALSANGIDVKSITNSYEVIHEFENNIKFFGFAEISEFFLLKMAVKIMLYENCTYFLALPSNLNPKKVVDIGWTGSFKDDSFIVYYVIDNKGLLFSQH